MTIRPKRRLTARELMLSNCGAGEDSWESLGLQGRRSNQSILKEISPEYLPQGLMLKLKLQCFGHLMWTADWLEKTLMPGKTEGRRRGWQRMRWLDAITNLIDMSLSELRGVGDGQGGLACCDSWGCKESDTTERLNWTELNWTHLKGFPCSSVGKGSACSAGDPGSIPGLGRSPGEGNSNPLHILAWKISGTEEPDGLQPIGLQRVGYDWATNTYLLNSLKSTLMFYSMWFIA